MTRLIKDGGRLFDERYSRCTGLGELLESDSPKDQWKAAVTLNMLEEGSR
jgi:hypothetical protein